MVPQAFFLVALLHPAIAMRNILFAGLFSVLFNRCNGYHQTSLCISLKKGEVYAFSLFVIMSVFVWAIFAAACAKLAKRFHD